MTTDPKTVGAIGEFNLIARLRAICGVASSPDTLIGIGDDTAVLRLNGEDLLLATCDIQIEGTHFRFDTITPYQLGRRAMAVNLSDIAAMGGQPGHAFVSLAMPAEFPVAGFEALFEGMRDTMGAHGGTIDGGNLASTEGRLMIDVFLLGRVRQARLLTRSGAKIGDHIFVTGSLGASSAGLAVLSKFGRNFPPSYSALVHAHLEPEPRVAAGQALAASGAVTAMIDVSDGLAPDLGHLCRASGVGAEIESASIPQHQEIAALARALGRDPADFVLHGGEDYELLFTALPERDSTIEMIAEEIGMPMTRIGQITDQAGGISLIDGQGSRSVLASAGWDHFRKQEGIK